MSETPINPYIVGNPVSREEMFFGRQDVFDFIRRHLPGEFQNNVIVLYGQRRTGKTSVLYQMHRLGPGYVPVLVDLSPMEMRGLAGFLWELAGTIRRELSDKWDIRLPRPDRHAFFRDPRQQFQEAVLGEGDIALGGRHLLLMFDEAVLLGDRVQEGRLEPDVFGYLSFLMQHYPRLDFIFCIGSDPELMQEQFRLMFRTCVRQRISFLEPDAARALITEPVQKVYSYEPAAIERIMAATSGHAYYTQLICHALFARRRPDDCAPVRVADVEAILPVAVDQGGEVLGYVWDESKPEERVVMAVLAELAEAGQPATAAAVGARLREQGVLLPQRRLTRSLRSLVEREVITSPEPHRFWVELMRFWLTQHRQLAWVRDEEKIVAALPVWEAERRAEEGMIWQRRPWLAWVGIAAAVLLVAVLTIFASMQITKGRIDATVTAVVQERATWQAEKTAIAEGRAATVQALSDQKAALIAEQVGTPAPLPSSTSTPASTMTPAVTPSPTATLLTPSPMVHVVQSGDTLISIAARYGVPVSSIMRVNSLTSLGQIVVGQQLLIPIADVTPSPPEASATPTAPPLATPRVSPTLTPWPILPLVLADYPRPPGDNGRGVHWSASNPAQVGMEVLQEVWLPELEAMDIRWVKFLHPYPEGIEFARLLLKEGIMPVVWLYRYQPYPKGVIGPDELEYIDDYVAAGVHYFEIGNEPDSSVEWQGSVQPEDWLDQFVDSFIRDAGQVIERGGLAGFPAFASLPSANPFQMIADRGRAELFDRMWVAVHNYPFNWPLDYPDDPVNQQGQPLTQAEYDTWATEKWEGSAWNGDTLEEVNELRTRFQSPGQTVAEVGLGWRIFEAYDEMVRAAAGRPLPIIVTDTGPWVGERSDRRYPAITPLLHAERMLEMYQYLQEKAPDYFFAACPWLLADEQLGGTGVFEEYAWYSDRWPDGQLPVVKAVKELVSPPTPTPTKSPTSPPPTRTLTPRPTATPTLPPFPSTARIFFVSNRDGDREIYSMAAEGGSVSRLTNSPGHDDHPDFSPITQKVAFESEREGNAEIYVMNSDGSGLQNLTRDPAWDWAPAWSPDGKRIVFVCSRYGDPELCVMDANGSDVRRLTNQPAMDDDPAWSPDGKQIVFVSERDTEKGLPEIYVMGADGSNLQRLTYNHAADVRPAWSPDGQHIIFTRIVQDTTGDGRLDSAQDLSNVHIMNADGSDQRNLTEAIFSENQPVWSPDGGWIAFIRYIGNVEVFVMDAYGGNVRNVSNNPADDWAPTWGR